MKRKFKQEEFYHVKEKVNIDKKFWWEKLPLIKHLVTKRAMAKHSHPLYDLLIIELGYEIKSDKKGNIYLNKKGNK